MQTMKKPLEHVYWLGGASCTGKSSHAKAIARRFGFHVYHTDEHAFGTYMFGIPEAEILPAVARYRELILKGIDDFATRAADVSFAAFTAFCREVFPLLVRDLAALSPQRVIAEGAQLFPELVASCAVKGQAVFLTAAPEFRETIWKKEMNGEIPGGNQYEIENFNKSVIQDKIVRAHAAFHDLIAAHISAGARAHDFPCVAADGGRGEADIENRILELFSIVV